jgi:hypothetical protein
MEAVRPAVQRRVALADLMSVNRLEVDSGLSVGFVQAMIAVVAGICIAGSMTSWGTSGTR